MKALTYSEFGNLDVLRLEEVEAPPVHNGRLLVRVHAASINPVDGKLRRGLLKLMSGTHFPKGIGGDFAGVVEAVGEGVSGFQVGDAVYGCTGSVKEGALAELVSVPTGVIAKKPSTLDFVQAASTPVVLQAALQALRDVARCQAGARVLVNGCTGGVGLYAVQLAKKLGAHVTGVCGTEGLDLARSVGADELVDYRKGSVLTSGQTFDVVLELSGRLPFAEAHAILGEHGVYVDFEPSPASLVGNAIANPFRAHKHRFVMTSSRAEDLQDLARRFDAGELRVSPTRVFDLADFRRAFELAEKGGVLGKVVLKLS